MEIILVEDVDGVGTRGTVVNVKPGYARNYLLPRKLAIRSTVNAASLYRELQRQREVQEDKRLAVARAEAAKLNGVEVNIAAAANEEDTLFGSVTETDVAEALARAGHPVDRHRIVLDEHLKQLGKYDVTVRVYGDVTAVVKVWVVRP